MADNADRPLRADAVRNRDRVLEVAYKTFAVEGVSVPIDEIARRAGVGAGTVYRHFNSKDDLVRTIVTGRLSRVIDEGRAMLKSGDPGDALFGFLHSLVFVWGATDAVLKIAVASADIRTSANAPQDPILGLLNDLLRAAQHAGTARLDVKAADLKTLIVGCHAMHAYDNASKQALTVVFDGLRRG